MLDTKERVSELLKAEHIREYLTEKGREIVAEIDKNLHTQNQVPVANTEEERFINMIVGGLEICAFDKLSREKEAQRNFERV